MTRTPWVERRFKLNAPEGWIFNFICRLEGTVPRLHALCKDLDEDDASRQPTQKWSIKQHIGHLYDLEFLHIERLVQLKSRIPALTGADMSNRRTDEADHNESPLAELIDKFSDQRGRFIGMLGSIDDETAHFKSLHPRLNIYMRPVDLAEFTAEHDDHHLCSISRIISTL